MLVTIVLLCWVASAIAVVQPPDIPPRPPCRRGEKCRPPFPINVCGLRKPIGPRCSLSSRKCPLGFTCILGQCCGDRLQLPDIPPRPPCRRGEKCPAPFPINVCGLRKKGPRCRPGRKCSLGFTCIREQCCGERPVFPPPLGGLCPPVRTGTAGICVELCNNCEARGMMCCSNGCGHVCKRPIKVPIPGRGCPVGQFPLGQCFKTLRCPKGSSCHKGTCCRPKLILPPRPRGCPSGQFPTGRCFKTFGCPKGSSCYKGTCCRPKLILPPRPRGCPSGQFPTGRCFKTIGCPKGSSCHKGTCCRPKLILPPRPGGCPSGQFPVHVPGRCLKMLGCPKGSSCHKGTCCRPKLILPPRPRECPSGQFPVNVPGRCLKTLDCPKGSSCYKGNCCRPNKTLPPGRFCPMGAGLPKFPRCPKFPTKIPLCKTDKDCGKTDKCCRDICGRRRCTKTMPFPPFGKIPL